MPPDPSGPESVPTVETGPAPPARPGCVEIDVMCPQCEYNLRGLAGPIVACPECGLESDVPVLASRQWTKPWYKAPGFNTLILPGGCAFLSLFILNIVDGLTHSDPMIGSGTALIVLALWVWLMIRAYRVLNGWLGVVLALIGHGLVIGIFVSVLAIIILLITGVLTLIEGGFGLTDTSKWFAAILLAIFVFAVCRIIEREIAKTCIRHHLRHKPTQ